MDVSFAAELTISELKRKGLANSTEVSKFKKKCLNFLVTAAAKLFDGSPLETGIVKHARCLNPKHFSSNAVESMKILLDRFTFLKIIPATTPDKALLQFSSIITNRTRKSKSFQRYEKYLQDLRDQKQQNQKDKQKEGNG